MSDWVAIGVPTSAGAHHAGQDRAPSALREAGLLDNIAIEDAVKAFGTMLSPTFAGKMPDTTEENIQSRIRGVTLMALSVLAMLVGQLRFQDRPRTGGRERNGG